VEKIPGTNMIWDFPFDALHNADFGAMRTFLIYVIDNVPKYELNERKSYFITPLKLEGLSKVYMSLAKHIPVEFARKPRAFEDIKFWKATEFRLIALYTGPVILLVDCYYYYYYYY
jgi:hypothetical protein